MHELLVLFTLKRYYNPWKERNLGFELINRVKYKWYENGTQPMSYAIFDIEIHEKYLQFIDGCLQTKILSKIKEEIRRLKFLKNS